jgi:hypothetical protein
VTVTRPQPFETAVERRSSSAMALGGQLMKSYDLIVVGAGSGNMLLGPELDHLTTAIVVWGSRTLLWALTSGFRLHARIRC